MEITQEFIDGLAVDEAAILRRVAEGLGVGPARFGLRDCGDRQRQTGTAGKYLEPVPAGPVIDLFNNQPGC